MPIASEGRLDLELTSRNMNRVTLIKILPWVTGLVAIAILSFWFLGSRNPAIQERVPGTDRAAGQTAAAGPSPRDSGKLIVSNGVPAQLTGSWPRFRGPNLDGISPDPAPLARSWPASGPPIIWEAPVGEGFAGAAIAKGRVYLMDYDQPAQADAIRCLSLEDGREIWRYTYPVKVKRNHGMSRTIPTVTDGHVITIGPKCHVTCLDALTGERRWFIDLVEEYQTEVPEWYAGQCPLVIDDRLYLAPGGTSLIIAVDCQSGQVLWKTPNPRLWKMTHSSIMPITWNDQAMLVYCASGGVAAVSPQDGRLLWEYPDWKISIANVPSPLPVPDGRIFFSGGYNAGSLMLQLKQEGDQLSVAPLFRLKASVFGATQQTPIFYKGHIYGIRPDGQLVCLDLEGRNRWASGPEHRFGNGPLFIAQDMIFAMNDSGQLTLAQATADSFQLLSKATVLPGPDAWAPMALSDGRLIVRDLYLMRCLDVSQKAPHGT